MTPLKIVFAGTPDFAAECLNALLKSEHDIVAVYTQPDRPAGRGKKLQPSPVKQLALGNQIPVEQPLNFKNSDDTEHLASYQADLMIVVAYGLLLPKAVLGTPKLGCINVHASLLPRWRGAAPIQRAIEAGDKETGVGIMQMDEGLDTGAIWCEGKLPITDTETGASLHDKLAALGAQTLLQALPHIAEQNSQPTPQLKQGITYAHKLSKQEAEIDWSDSAAHIERKIRAFNSWPVAFFKINNDPIRVWDAMLIANNENKTPGEVIQVSKDAIVVACGENAIALKELHPAGSRRMKVADLLNSKAHWFVEGQPLGGA